MSGFRSGVPGGGGVGLPSRRRAERGHPRGRDEGRSGWLLHPSNTNEITATIIELLTSPEKLQRASEFSCRPPASRPGSVLPRRSWRRRCEVQLAGGGTPGEARPQRGGAVTPLRKTHPLEARGLHGLGIISSNTSSVRRAVSCQVSARALSRPFSRMDRRSSSEPVTSARAWAMSFSSWGLTSRAALPAISGLAQVVGTMAGHPVRAPPESDSEALAECGKTKHWPTGRPDASRRRAPGRGNGHPRDPAPRSPLALTTP